MQHKLAILDGIIAQVVVAGREKDMAVPVCHSAVSTASHVNPW
jgi:hypothetical protein